MNLEWWFGIVPVNPANLIVAARTTRFFGYKRALDRDSVPKDWMEVWAAETQSYSVGRGIDTVKDSNSRTVELAPMARPSG